MTITCKVCGESINGTGMVNCSKCDTPHHSDCFQYAGKCSTFGCGNNKYYSENDKKQLHAILPNQTTANSITDLVINENQSPPKKRSLYGRTNAFSQTNEYSRFLKTNLVTGTSQFDDYFENINKNIDNLLDIDFYPVMLLPYYLPTGSRHIFLHAVEDITRIKRQNKSFVDSVKLGSKFDTINGLLGGYLSCIPLAFFDTTFLLVGSILGGCLGKLNTERVIREKELEQRINTIKSDCHKKLEKLSEG